mgnify:CR=1 FL=1
MFINEDRASLPDGWITKSIPVIKALIDNNNKVTGSIKRHLVYIFNQEGKTICGVYNPRHKTYCKMLASKGSNRCYLHGGKSNKV